MSDLAVLLIQLRAQSDPMADHEAHCIQRRLAVQRSLQKSFDDARPEAVDLYEAGADDASVLLGRLVALVS